MKLILIRHAEAEGNPEKRLLGRSNPGLTPRGQLQALALGNYFAQHQASPNRIWTSPLERAHSTAQCLAPNPAQIQSLDILTEIDQGILTGLTWAEAQQAYPNLTEKLESQLEWWPIPQAESPKQAQRRAQQVWSRLLEQVTNQDRVWVISHAGFLQHLLAVVLGMDKVWQIKILPSAWFELEIELPYLNHPPGQENQYNSVFWKIHHFNSLAHWSTPES